MNVYVYKIKNSILLIGIVVLFCSCFISKKAFAEKIVTTDILSQYIVPGSGYVFKQAREKKPFPYLKTFVFTLPAWLAYYKEFTLTRSLNAAIYGEELVIENRVDKDKRTDSRKGNNRPLNETYMNKEGWEAQAWGRLSLNLFLMTAADIARNPTQESDEIYDFALAPLNIFHWGTNWRFWLPISVLLSAQFFVKETEDYDFNTGGGLKKPEVMTTELSNNYMTGIAEEMFFRGFIQHSMYQKLDSINSWSNQSNYFISLISSAAIFGLAHDGQQGAATSEVAFVMGLYFGYTAYPSPSNPMKEDLISVIALHAWWDIITSIGQYHAMHFHTHDKAISCYAVVDHQVRCREIGDISKRVFYPLLHVGFKY